MTYSRNVAALSFVALLGIGIGILSTISARKKKEKAPSSKTRTTGRDPDRISQLPDDVLILIIKVLSSTKDVVSTSILSKRWRNLYNCTCRLHQRFIKILGGESSSCPQERFIKGVDKSLGLYSGYSRIISCQLKCCFTESFPNKVEEWIQSLGRLGIQQLSLTFKCSYLEDYEEKPDFSCRLIYEAPRSLQFLSLTRCILQPYFKTRSRYNTIKTLHLTKVTIDPGALECIMANCLNLEYLVIQLCTLSSQLCIRHPQLKDLSVISCTTFEKIELHAGNLTRFEFIALELGQLYFHYVPLLGFLSLKLHGDILMQFLFGQLAELSQPLLKSEYNQELSVTNMFSNLRRLDLRIYNLPEQLSESKVLDLCPLLEELNITSINAGTFQKEAESRVFDEEQVKKRSVNFHTNLKKVGFSGFSGTTSEIKFALYIIRSAIALDQMYISCYYKDFFAYGYTYAGLSWTEDKIKRMHQRFQGNAISDSAKIVFSLPRIKSILKN